MTADEAQTVDLPTNVRDTYVREGFTGVETDTITLPAYLTDDGIPEVSPEDLTVIRIRCDQISVSHNLVYRSDQRIAAWLDLNGVEHNAGAFPTAVIPYIYPCGNEHGADCIRALRKLADLD